MAKPTLKRLPPKKRPRKAKSNTRGRTAAETVLPEISGDALVTKAAIEKAGGVGGSGSGSSTAIKFTQSDIQRLTATGLTSKDIANIQADINAHGIDAVLPGLPEAQRKVVQDVLKGVTPSQAGSSTSKQYLSTDYLKANIDQKELESDALAAGYFTKGGGLFNTGLFASKKPDVNAYVNSLMDQIKNLRAQGKDDDTILKTLGFAK